MQFLKLALLLVTLLSLSACAPQPAEDATTTDTSTQEGSPAVEPEPTPAAKPTPAKPARREPSTSTAIVRDVPAPKKRETVVIPSGTELAIILADPLNSGKNKTGDEFSGNLAAPVYVSGVAILERGAKVQGTVVDAKESGRVSGKATMTLVLTGVMRDGKMVPISTRDFATEAESSTKRDVGIIGGGAGVGAVIGAIAGGKKGAATGAAIGGAAGTGTVLATKGKEVDFPAESKLSFVLERDVTLTL
jgi:hypothetical protein